VTQSFHWTLCRWHCYCKIRKEGAPIPVGLQIQQV